MAAEAEAFEEADPIQMMALSGGFGSNMAAVVVEAGASRYFADGGGGYGWMRRNQWRRRMHERTVVKAND